jgi:hypothetical protein
MARGAALVPRSGSGVAGDLHQMNVGDHFLARRDVLLHQTHEIDHVRPIRVGNLHVMHGFASEAGHLVAYVHPVQVPHVWVVIRHRLTPAPTGRIVILVSNTLLEVGAPR